jgi:hypothetical protein
MRAGRSVPVRYVLYSHYPEGKDFDAYKKGTPVKELQGVQYLIRHFYGLQGLLTWPGYEGLLVLFYAPGLAKCLELIESRKSTNDLVQECKELEFASAVETYLQDVIRQKYEELVPRLRFITALDLHKVFGRIRNKKVEWLRPWIVGDAKGIRYDSPKIVEAIVRLRLLGTGVPVFRVDYDVLFRGDDNRDKKNLEFSSTVGSCLTVYQRKRDSSNLSSFIFSASYDHQPLLDRGEADKFHTWTSAFATRVFPALLVKNELMEDAIKAIRTGEKSEADAWDLYATQAFSPSLARKFFGFDSHGFKTSQVKGIGKIGAHPMASVISGAMLYLSDGAILDLPPFSNFYLNVSWIDDHLKYCLHRELRHLSPIKLRPAMSDVGPESLMAYSKLDNVIVHKAGRKIQKDLRIYIFDEYLPTLLRGTIMDAWITHYPLIKYRPEDLSDEDQDAWSRIPRGRLSAAVLPSALQRALEECNLGPTDVLENKLYAVALERINEVRVQWKRLTETKYETFASIWAKGKARLRFPDLDLHYAGIPNPGLVRVNQDICRVDCLDGLLIQDLQRLVKDAIEYINWTLNWPAIVQVVRSIEQGTLRTDLNFDPEREDRG